MSNDIRRLMQIAEAFVADEERDYHEEWVQHFVDMGKSKLWSLYNQTLEDDDYPGRTDELEHMEDALERMGIAVAESEGEDDLGPAAQGKSDVVKQVADEEGWDVEDFPLAEGEERPYICVHAKKGKHECYADTSYAAAKKAAEHWGLKSTAGIDAHLAIDEDTLSEGIGSEAIEFARSNRNWASDDELIEIAREVHGEQYAKAVAHYLKRTPNPELEEDDDGDVPSRRVSDEELLAKVTSKIDDALKSINMGVAAEEGNGDAKLRAIELRRDLKDLKAFIQSGADLLGLRPKLHLAFGKAENLADLSYEFDDVLWELNDADNLLYLHLSGRPVAIDEESCPCGREDCECGPDCDCEPINEVSGFEVIGSAVILGFIGWAISKGHSKLQHIARKKAALDVLKDFEDNFGDAAIEAFAEKLKGKLKSKSPQTQKALMTRIAKLVKFINEMPDEEKWYEVEWHVREIANKINEVEKFVKQSNTGVDRRKAAKRRATKEEYALEEITLEGIVESVLQEFRGQPKDYEMSDEELAAEIEDQTSEYERDRIDPEIEDEELGLRFD